MSEPQIQPQSLGLLAFLDPAVKAAYEASRTDEDRRRDYAIERLAALYGCSQSAAREWLDRDDEHAIEWAAAGIPKELIN